MTPRQRARAREIFQQLLDLPEGEQERALDAACPDDAEVRAMVLDMLREDRARGGDDFAPLVSPLDASQLAASIAESPGMWIGPYRIVSVLGEGGFGTVFLAEQSTPIHRQVALKVVKLGMDTRQVITRFQRERQAMAVLDHPNIAKVYDAGATDSGRPYFAMEVCPGEPITRYCDAAKMTIAQRIAIVCTVCRAVHHAHQRGLIHRDLKPSNILVSDVDATPVPKVIDFGIAKAIRQDLRSDTMMSVQQQFLGTPEYSSPEQALGESDVDTRADVYSLGVLLYELLTGETPISSETLRTGNGRPLLKLIIDAGVAPPSARLHAQTRHVSQVSALRATEPSKLRAQLRRDLDWVVLRAIEKDRDRRYGSVAELAQDLERYLRGEAVLAAPPSTWYALRKSARRHRPTVIAAALVLVTLLLGIVGTVSQAREARKEAATARAAEAAQMSLAQAEAQRSQELERVAEFQAEMLRSLDPFTMGTNLADDMRARLAQSLRLDGLPEAEQASLLAGFDAAMARLNTTDIASDLLGREILEPSIRAVDESFMDQPRSRGLLHANVAASYTALSMRPEAAAEYRKAVEALAKGLGPDDRRVLEVMLDELLMLIAMDEHEAMQVRGPDLLARAQRLLAESDPLRLSIERDWAACLRRFGRLEESLALHMAVLDKCKRFLPPTSEVTNDSATKTAAVLTDLGRYQEAEALLLEAIRRSSENLGANHSYTLSIKKVLATVYLKSGRYEESLAVVDELIRTRTPSRGLQNVRTINPLMTRTEILIKLGRFDEAEADCRKILAAIASRQGVDFIRMVIGPRLAWLLAQRQDFAGAESVLLQQIQRTQPRIRGPLLRELVGVYDQWAMHDPTTDFTGKHEAARAQLAELEPDSARD